MWFWLMLIIAVVLTIAAIYAYKYDDCSNYTFLLSILSGVSICIVLVMGLIIIINHTGIEANIAQNKQVYNSLVYQLENELYENDNDLGKKELYNQIEDWNKDLAYYQAIQDEFWNGIFHPNIYDQFEYITLPKSVS